MSRVTTHVPMVAGLAYRETVTKLPGEFTAVLKPDPAQPYNPQALAVYGPGGKLGYIAPEIARHCYEQVTRAGEVTCPARHKPGLSRTTGVEAVLDLSAILSG